MVAQRYGVLPSEVWERSNIIDFWVMKASQEFYRSQEPDQTGKKKTPKLDVNTMEQMIRRVRDGRKHT